MTHDQAIGTLRRHGWCYQHQHPYSGPFDWIIVGERMDSESYGPFPEGFVIQEWGHGDSLVEAVEDAVKKFKASRGKKGDNHE